MGTPPTSLSLLVQARDRTDVASWRRLLDLYTPLIRGLVRSNVAQPADADDVVQDVLAMLVTELPGFRHNDRPGAFRSWLRAITVNRLRCHWRDRSSSTGDVAAFDRLRQLEDENSSQARLWDQEHDRHVAAMLLESIDRRPVHLQLQFEQPLGRAAAVDRTATAL